uniref:DUF5880 domain-containing protein n=1 Tax=Eutreptiella gymnastica TaxID=73025 RepID=A0A7S1N2Z6_9EUGL
MEAALGSIMKMMTGSGPIVKCVLLAADGKASELSIDMSPSQNGCAKALKCARTTFVGPIPHLSAVVLQNAAPKAKTPKNKHRLPPPVDKEAVVGSALVIRMDENVEPADISLSEYLSYCANPPSAKAARKVPPVKKTMSKTKETAKKAAPKKALAKKDPVKKALAKKAPAKKAPGKGSAKKAPVKKASAKKAPAKKTPFQKPPPKKAAAKKTPAKKAPPQKASVKQAPTKQQPVTKGASKKKSVSKKMN